MLPNEKVRVVIYRPQSFKHLPDSISLFICEKF